MDRFKLEPRSITALGSDQEKHTRDKAWLGWAQHMLFKKDPGWISNSRLLALKVGYFDGLSTSKQKQGANEVESGNVLYISSQERE